MKTLSLMILLSLAACGRVQNSNDGAGQAEGIATKLQPITISNVQISAVTQNSAKLSFVTNVPMRGWANYGVPGLIKSTAMEAVPSTSHSFVFSNLKNNTSYVSQAAAIYSDGRSVLSGAYSFRTAK